VTTDDDLLDGEEPGPERVPGKLTGGVTPRVGTGWPTGKPKPRPMEGPLPVVDQGSPNRKRAIRDARTGLLMGSKAGAGSESAKQRRARLIREAAERGEILDVELVPAFPNRPTPLPVPLAEDREPWERQPKEAAKAFACFVVYRDLGPMDRTVSAAARALGVTRTVPQRMSLQWRWEERAAAWDNDRQKQFDATRRQQQEVAIRSHENIARALVSQVARILQRQQTLATPESRVLRDAALTIDKAIFHHRLALGLPTEVSRQDQYLKSLIDEMVANQAKIMALLEETLCDDCRAEVRGKIAEIKKTVSQTARKAAS